MRVLIAVTHLLGAGHLTRAAALARAFARKGHETMLVSGGSPVRLSDLANVTYPLVAVALALLLAAIVGQAAALRDGLPLARIRRRSEIGRVHV